MQGSVARDTSISKNPNCKIFLLLSLSVASKLVRIFSDKICSVLFSDDVITVCKYRSNGVSIMCATIGDGGGK